MRSVRSITIIALLLIGLIACFSLPILFIWDDISDWEREAISTFRDSIASLPLSELLSLTFGLLALLLGMPFGIAALFRCARKCLQTTSPFIRIPVQCLKATLISAGVLAVLAGFWLDFVWHHPPSSVPIASITLMGYTKVTLTNTDTAEEFDPGRGTWLKAEMRLRNEGSKSISYYDSGDEPRSWISARTDYGPTNGCLALPYGGVLYPGSNVVFWAYLPTNTLRWQCSLEVNTASLRYRAISRVIDSSSLRIVPDQFFDAVRFLPDEPGPALEVKTQVFDIENGIWSAAPQLQIARSAPLSRQAENP